MMDMSPKATITPFGNTCDQRLESNIFKNKQFELTVFMFTFVNTVCRVFVTMAVSVLICHVRTLEINVTTFSEKIISLLQVTV